MTNNEIGTYQIAEAVLINPKMKVMRSGESVVAMINGDILTGNIKVLESSIDCSKMVWVNQLQDNLIEQEKSALDILSEAFGIVTEADWDGVYKQSEVWTKCQKLANKKEIKTESKFELDDNRGSL